MKLLNTLLIIIFIVVCLVSSAIATNVNGRVKLINNDGNNYKVMLQINTDNDPTELGGATIVIDYDNSIVSFPDEPEMGIDFIFNNFNMGFYDTAKVTKVKENQIWINIDLVSDEYGTMVAGGPYLWTDVVLLNFVSNGIVTKKVIFWNIYSSYWGVYDSDNFTTWGIGNFDNITTEGPGENLDSKNYSYTLSQNYPNPFNPSTTFAYNINASGNVKLEIFDVLGNKIAELVKDYQTAGSYSVKWVANDPKGLFLPSGIYIARLQWEGKQQAIKITLMK